MTDEALVKLFDTVGPRFGDRNGGYTRIIRTGWNKGDGADKAFLELLGSEKVLDEKRDLVTAAIERAMVELARLGPAAAPYTDQLLDAAGSDDRLIRQAALVALPQRDRAALRDAAPALRDLTSSIDALAD